MKFAEKTFISSTFWTERVGPTAAVKTLEIMNRTKSWQKITKTGKKIKKEWNRLANKYQLKIGDRKFLSMKKMIFLNHFSALQIIRGGFLGLDWV